MNTTADFVRKSFSTNAVAVRNVYPNVVCNLRDAPFDICAYQTSNVKPTSVASCRVKVGKYTLSRIACKKLGHHTFDS